MAALMAGCRWVAGGGGAGSFDARVTGAVTATLSGRASAATLGRLAGEGYAITLAVPDGRAIYLYTRTAPRAGSYTVHPFTIGQPAEGYKAAFLSQPNGAAYQATSGTVDLTSPGGSRLKGRFQFQAEATPGAAGVTVAGTFTLP
ncbi:MAG TPA: hypothetical protein VFJ16_05445 [Longimicrobium sp.]|nr:hypothetical protein [Longimicrobium sp.]